MNEIFNNEDFKKEDVTKQLKVLSNYFDKELTDEEFKTKDDSKQQQIKENFIMKTLSDIGSIKPREDGAGFLTRTKFSFADTEKGKKQVLEDEYGKGNAYKYGDRWLVNEGGKKGFNFVDENKLSWKDAADLVGDVPEVAGATAGAVLGSGLMSIPAAAAGGAAGTGIKKLIAKAMGINDGQTPTEIAKDLGESALWSGGGQAVGLGLIKGANKVLAPFADKMTPEAIARRELASKYGVELTPAQVTQSPALGMLENGMKNNLASVETIKDFLNTRQMMPFSEAVKGITPQSDSSSIGENIIKSIIDSQKTKAELFGKQYDELASQIDSPIEMSNLKNATDNIIGKKVASSQDLSPEFQRATDYNSFLQNNNNGFDYNLFKNSRTNLISDLQADKTLTGSAKTGDTKYLKSSMDKDFNDYAIANGLGDTKKALDSNYADYKTLYDKSKIADALARDEKGKLFPENIQDLVVNIKEPSRIDLFKKAGANQDDIRDIVINKVIDKGSVSDSANPSFGSSFVPPSRLATQAYDYGENLSRVGADNVRELGKVAEGIKFSEAFLNHSNTAPTLQNSNIVGIAGTVPFYPMSKAYTSDIGRKYLTDGLGKINPKYSGFGAAFAPLMNQD